MKKLLCIAAALLLLLPACQRDEVSEAFRQNSVPRLEIKGFVTFAYDSLTCQKAFNRERHEFRLFSDNVADFFTIKLDAVPSETGQKVVGSATWTTGRDIHTKKTTFEVIRTEGGKAWLWSSANRIAAVVEMLD